jgi:hypothetical protein
VANARKLRLIYANKREMDEIDALRTSSAWHELIRSSCTHPGTGVQAHLALIRSREALVSSGTQLVNPGYAERSSPSVIACPSVQPEASTSGLRAQPSGTLAGPGAHLGADRFAHRAHQGLREAAGGDLPRALSGNESVEAGRGDRDAYRAHVRGHLGGPLPRRKEQDCRSILRACASQRSLRREGSSETHLQGRRRDVKEAIGRQRSLRPGDLSAPIRTSGAMEKR